jgi:hypothetical protein
MLQQGVRKNAVLRTYVGVPKRGCKLIDLSNLQLPMGAVDIPTEVFGLIPIIVATVRIPSQKESTGYES